MAKRGSDHQITRDDDNSDGDEDVQVGMVKADPTVLANRPMRGLPKRKGATPLATSTASSNSSSAAPTPAPTFSGFGAPTPPTSDTKPSDAPRFSGFSGFGAPAPAAAAAPKPAETPRFAAFAGFGSAPTTTKTDTPAEAKPAETPRFAAFAGFGSLKPAASAQPTPEPAKPPVPTESKTDSTAALTYWTSLRGLNHAFVESVKRAIEADMFCDVGTMFAQYTEHRAKVVKDFDESKKTTTPAPAPTPKPIASAPEVPKAASSSTGFGFGSSTSTTSQPSPFSFGSSKPAEPAAPKSHPTGLNLPSSKPTGFGSSDLSLVTPSATPPTVPPSPRKPTAAFGSFGAGTVEPTPTPSPMPEGNTSSVFDLPVPKTATPQPPKPTFTFGSSTPSAHPFGGATPKADAKPFSFSTSNNNTAASPAISTTATAGSSVKPFSFNTPLSTPGTPFAFGAGSPKGVATPRPGPGSVGFSFGSSPPRKETGGFPFGLTSVTPAGLDSGASSAIQTPKEEHGSDEEKVKRDDDGAAGDDIVSEETDRTQGAGEENEDTLYSVRARVLRFYKQAWVGVGIGTFKVKYDRETKKRRILHRLEGTGRVVLNCRMFPQMDPVKEPKGILRFTGTDDQGGLMLYRVKVKTDDEAEALMKSFTEALEASKTD